MQFGFLWEVILPRSLGFLNCSKQTLQISSLVNGPGDRADGEDRALFGGLSCKIKFRVHSLWSHTFLMLQNTCGKPGICSSLFLSLFLRFRGYRITYNLFFNSEYPWKLKFILSVLLSLIFWNCLNCSWYLYKAVEASLVYGAVCISLLVFLWCVLQDLILPGHEFFT